ncbi:MAG: hypothetical protein ACR2NU_11105 [Aeoliella sp.]
MQAPSLPSNSPAPPKTFQESQAAELPAIPDPVPAEESSFEEQNAAAWDEAPQLLDPRDKLTKQPTAPVWTAVYKRSADASAKTRPEATSISQPKQKKTIGWTSGR